VATTRCGAICAASLVALTASWARAAECQAELSIASIINGRMVTLQSRSGEFRRQTLGIRLRSATGCWLLAR
jgi:hypothetical protein